ncbi:MAG: TonB-dependent receptor [Cryobacterium sp.]|nr:TonB-dependent receptor [Oligoflexia bacterium]
MNLRLISAVFVLAMLPIFARAADVLNEVILDPVVAAGTTAEALKHDPVIPAYIGKTKGQISTGNIAKEIANDLPFHSNANLKPGNEVGFVGVGKGAEETDVNLLGIPVNRPQGGGADLATFPQYFWSGYSYQIGPSLGAFDPRGVGGSLTLRLWTQENLGTESYRATAYHSTRRIQQFSLGKSSERYAILAGMTTDAVTGPGLSFSAVPFENGALKLTTHLIYSQTDVDQFLSEKRPSQSAHQTTYRFIPVIQADAKLSEQTRLKSSLFYDLGYVRYEDRLRPADDQRKKTTQIGNETALITGDTRLGFGIRNVTYRRSISSPIGDFPSEQILNVQATQGFKKTTEEGFVLFEPTVGGYAVSRQGFFPTATLGLRNERKVGEGKYGQFLRVGYTKRFPSLLDRYYELLAPAGPGSFIQGLPNPDLRPENVRSAEFGADYGNGRYKNQITFFARDYKHARYTRFTFVSPSLSTFQIQNAGNAYVYGATQSQDFKALPILDFGTRLTYQRSQIEDLNAAFPYSPKWVGILKFDLHDADEKYGLEIVNKLASGYVAYTETTTGVQPLPGYYYLDLFARAVVAPGVNVTLGIENAFDRPIQFRIGDPDLGRIYSLAASAAF